MRATTPEGPRLPDDHDHDRAAVVAGSPAAPRRRAWPLVAGGLAVGLVLGGCTGLGVGLVVGGSAGAGLAEELRGTAGAPVEDGAAADGRTVAEALPDELPRLRELVARERGVAWREEVPVEALDDAAFAAALEGTDTGGEGTDADGGTGGELVDGPPGLDDPGGGRAEAYAALGLTPSATAFRAAAEAGDADVVGFYDGTDGSVLLRGQEWTPLVERVLVHELTHALDDQQVDLDARLDAPRTPEQWTAEVAVVEGSAERVAWAWYDALDADGRAAYDAALEADAAQAPPDDGARDPLADALAFFPYDYGYLPVEAVAEEGPDAVDALLAAPLTTTEQVLAAVPDPGAATGLEPAAAVEAPPVPDGAEALGTGGLGLLGLSLLPLVGTGEEGGYAFDPADVVTDAWTGDAWTAWTDPDDPARVCVAVRVLLDEAAGRDALLAGLAPWADARAGQGEVVASGERGVELTGCGDA